MKIKYLFKFSLQIIYETFSILRRIQPDSTMTVQPDSIMTVQPDSIMTVQPDSIMTVQPDSIMTVQPDSTMTVPSSVVCVSFIKILPLNYGYLNLRSGTLD